MNASNFRSNHNKARRHLTFGVLALMLWLFAHTALEVTENTTGDLAWLAADQHIAEFITSESTPDLTEVMRTFTYIGSTLSVSIIVLFTLLLFFFKKNFSAARILLFASLGGILFTRAAKGFFGRVRPDPVNWLVPASGLSFPSGHTTSAFAVLGALFWVLGKSCDQRYQRAVIWTLGLILMVMIGYSRIYLRVHYPTDVLGGILLGSSILLLAIGAEHFLRGKFR